MIPRISLGLPLSHPLLPHLSIAGEEKVKLSPEEASVSESVEARPATKPKRGFREKCRRRRLLKKKYRKLNFRTENDILRSEHKPERWDLR